MWFSTAAQRGIVFGVWCVWAVPACKPGSAETTIAKGDVPGDSRRDAAGDSPRDAAVDAGSEEAAPRLVPADASTSTGFCERPGDDAVRDVFCGKEPAPVTSIRDLQQRLGLDLDADSGNVGSESVVALGHSTALSGQLVSPINPRVIVIGENTFLAFNRGIQQVEVATADRDSHAFKFYLVTFVQACNAAPGGCTPGDLYTPRIESSWTRATVRDDEELKNTSSDCRQCHQRAADAGVLLMRELEGPWTHFFAPDLLITTPFPETTGVDLVKDYLRAKGDETYGGIASSVLSDTVGVSLQNVLGKQPLLFEGNTIMTERWPYGPDGFASTPARSPTWYAGYEAFKRGEQLALPHYDPRPTDAVKQARLTAAYQRYRNGEMRAEDLPDLADIFPDDPSLRAEIGLQTEPGAAPAQALIEACGSCHNDVLDQRISRAGFNIALSRMGRAELDLAMTRMKISPGGAGRMPPDGTRQLDASGLERLLDYLKTNERSAEDDALLERAARFGMAGGQAPSANL